jgi:hypothetical protein
LTQYQGSKGHSATSDERKAEIELNFFEYSDSKRYLAEPDIVEYDKNNKPQYDLILGVKTMK